MYPEIADLDQQPSISGSVGERAASGASSEMLPSRLQAVPGDETTAICRRKPGLQPLRNLPPNLLPFLARSLPMGYDAAVE